VETITVKDNYAVHMRVVLKPTVVENT